MSTVKAIETEYNGYRFRSRLEARWAVFFDSMEIRYQYEPEGFEAAGGLRYLPDFYLTDLEAYVEVKPFEESRLPELKKCCELVRADPTKKIIVLGEIPNAEKMAPVFWFPCIYADPFDIGGCPRIRPVCLFTCDYLCGDHFVAKTADILATLSVYRRSIWYGRQGYICDDEMPYTAGMKWSETFSPDDLSFAKNAYSIARKARFEFGETPCGR